MAQTTVTSTPAALAPASIGSLILRNRGTVPVYIGLDATVTAANGFQVDANEALSISRGIPGQQTIWAVTASGTAVVHVLVGAA